VTAQKAQARVQRSPAIMKVAVPLLQHSQWLGHFALSQTVCSLSSSSSARVRENVLDVGSGRRNHSGSRGRTGGSARFEPAILLFQLLPKARELVGTEIGKDLAINIDNGSQFLTG